MSDTPRTFTCDRCGWEWKQFQSGEHNCLSRLFEQLTTAQTSLASVLAERDEARKERVSLLERLDRTCGCVTCICENEEKCQGCGAKNCELHESYYRERDTALSQVATLTQQLTEAVAERDKWRAESFKWAESSDSYAKAATPQPPVCKHCGRKAWDHSTHWKWCDFSEVDFFTPASPEPVSIKGGDEPCAAHAEPRQGDLAAPSTDSKQASNAAPDDVRPVSGERQERKHLVESAGYWYRGARTKTGPEAVMCMEQAYNHTENALYAANARIAELEADRISMISELGEVIASLATAQKQNAAMREALGELKSYILAKATEPVHYYHELVNNALSPSAGNQFVRREEVESAIQQLRSLWNKLGYYLDDDMITIGLTRAESALKTGGQEG